jgi:hypothetical protein
MACVSGLVVISGAMLDTLDTPKDLEKYLPSSSFQLAVGGILKQGVERLDNVRQLVGEELAKLLSTTKALANGFDPWRIRGVELFDPLVTEFVSRNQTYNNDGLFLFVECTVTMTGEKQPGCTHGL